MFVPKAIAAIFDAIDEKNSHGVGVRVEKGGGYYGRCVNGEFLRKCLSFGVRY